MTMQKQGEMIAACLFVLPVLDYVTMLFSDKITCS